MSEERSTSLTEGSGDSLELTPSEAPTPPTAPAPPTAPTPPTAPAPLTAPTPRFCNFEVWKERDNYLMAGRYKYMSAVNYGWGIFYLVLYYVLLVLVIGNQMMWDKVYLVCLDSNDQPSEVWGFVRLLSIYFCIGLVVYGHWCLYDLCPGDHSWKVFFVIPLCLLAIQFLLALWFANLIKSAVFANPRGFWDLWLTLFRNCYWYSNVYQTYPATWPSGGLDNCGQY